MQSHFRPGLHLAVILVSFGLAFDFVLSTGSTSHAQSVSSVLLPSGHGPLVPTEASVTPTPPPTGCQAVSWTSLQNVIVQGNSIRKMSGQGATWDAGAVSTQSLASGTGSAQATVDDIATYKLFGLSNGNSSPAQTDVDFALFMAGGVLKVYEGGILRNNFGSYAVGDTLKVAVEAGGVVRYYRNGTLLYASALAPTYPLLLDTSINSLGGWLTNAYLCGASLQETPTPVATSTATVSLTPPPTSTATSTAISTSTSTATASATSTAAATSTAIQSQVPTFTRTSTPKPTYTRTNTSIVVPTQTPTNTGTATRTNTYTPTASRTVTTTPTRTQTRTATRTATRTFTATVVPTPGGGPSLAGCPMFPANNIWNRNIASLPVHAQSDQFVASLGSNLTLHPSFGSGTWNGYIFGQPYNVVPPTQPLVTINIYQYPGESDPGPARVPTNAAIQAPTDSHALVLETGTCILYEMYHATPVPDGSWNAGSAARFNTTSNALRPNGWTSSDAAGFAILPGLVRYDEAIAGPIRHAVRFVGNLNGIRNTYIWPARHSDGRTSSTSAPPMGTRFRLKASVDISGYPQPLRNVLQGLKDYGMFLADSTDPDDSWNVGGTHDSRWNNNMMHAMNDFHGYDFEAVDQSGLMIDPNSGQSR